MPVSVVLEKVIRASPERVFAYRADLENLPKYNPAVTALRRVGDGYHFRVRVLGRFAAGVTLTVTEAKPPTRLVFDMKTWFNTQEVCTFEAIDEGTRIHFEMHVDTPSGPLGNLLERWFVVPNAERQVAEELETIRETLERG